MSELSEADKAEWREKYAWFFALYRDRYPRILPPQQWREASMLDSWAHAMVTAALLPGWLTAGREEREFVRLRKTMAEILDGGRAPEKLSKKENADVDREPHPPESHVVTQGEGDTCESG